LDTRREISRILGRFEIRVTRQLVAFLACVGVAAAVAFLPDYSGLSPAGVRCFFILLLAAGLWVTEAVPAFAVGILVIALEVALLGRPGAESSSGQEWQKYVEVWGNPLIWLFFGGLVLAAGATKTRLDRWFAANVLRVFGTRPAALLLGVMAITFLFSMFMSNTATTAMMLSVLAPLLATLGGGDRFGRGLLLGLCVAANLGGMATVIGTPPNAIAVGALSDVPGQGIGFARWMLIGLPPALLLAALAWFYLARRYARGAEAIDLDRLEAPPGIFQTGDTRLAPLWQRLAVMSVFVATVLLK
jgi:sodium-dependent dicarboxylate transporter 2/3/5